MNGAMFQMIAHGISSAGMFFLVGVIYDRVHHRNLDQFGGLFARMPVYGGISMGIFFAALGLPGLCGFVGEFFVVAGRLELQQGAGRRGGLGGDPHRRLHPLDDPAGVPGPEYKGPHGEALTPDDPPRDGHRRAAGGVGHPVRRLSAGAVRLHHAERAEDRDGNEGRQLRTSTTWPP